MAISFRILERSLFFFIMVHIRIISINTVLKHLSWMLSATTFPKLQKNNTTKIENISYRHIDMLNLF